MEVAKQGDESGYGVPCLLIAAKDDLDPYPMAIRDSLGVYSSFCFVFTYLYMFGHKISTTLNELVILLHVVCLREKVADNYHFDPSVQISHELGIEAPVRVSMKLNAMNNVFDKIVNVAEHPHASIPETEARRNRKKYIQAVNRSLMCVSGTLHTISLSLVCLFSSEFILHYLMCMFFTIDLLYQITVGAAAAFIGLAAYRAYAARRNTSG